MDRVLAREQGRSSVATYPMGNEQPAPTLGTCDDQLLVLFKRCEWPSRAEECPVVLALEHGDGASSSQTASLQVGATIDL